MDRRKFFKNGALLTAGATLVSPFETTARIIDHDSKTNNKTAKNIIILVSDGMSSGTLNMADLYANRFLGRGSHWLNLYRENKVSRGLMDMASASSMVTDSAAASSSWGSGFRVKNGALNIGVSGEAYLPIWQKFKKAGKKAGIVTTVPVTHATPAGFCVSSKSRNSQDEIAEKYLNTKFDVMLGGGQNHFDPSQRKDKKNLWTAFEKLGYQVAKTRTEMNNTKTNKPLLGVFFNDGLPYSIDRENIKDLSNTIPTLAEMTTKAIAQMKDHPNGFVLQVEAGKVDWAAHANCIGGLLYDQLAFDDAVKVAIDFAEADKETLVIITTDHGNANPGLLYGKNADKNFENLANFKHTNEWILNGIDSNTNSNQLKERVMFANNIALTAEQCQQILAYYQNIEKGEDGLYNYKKLPYQTFANIQKEYISVGWIGTDHSADYTEIAMFGPGSQNHLPFIKNTDLHYFMLKSAAVENNF